MTAPMFKSFEAPKVNRREIIRYMGAKELSAEQEALLDECLAEILPKLTYNVCWVETSVSTNEEGVCFDFAAFKSKGLKRNLDRCDKAVIFAATIPITPGFQPNPLTTITLSL